MEPLSFHSLVGEMTGKRTTNGYDVLVAYSQSKVNELLKARAKDSNNEHTLGPFTMKWWDLRNKVSYPMTVNLKVKSPVLEFQGLESITLKYDVEGGDTKVDTDPKVTLPKGLVLELSATLTQVSGSVNDAGEFTETVGSDGKPASVNPPGNKVALNPEDKKGAQAVCIDMKAVKAKVFAKEGSDKIADETAQTVNSIRSQIENYFQSADAVKYYIAGVSNTYDTKAKYTHVLRPVSFNFTIAGSGTDNAALCMWIEVSHGANNGTVSTTQSSVTFQPNEINRIPLVSGSTGCVVLSHDIVWSQFLKPGLEKGFFELKAQPSTNEAVFIATGLLNTENYYKDAVDDKVELPTHTRTLTRDEISFWPKWPESTITINRGIAKPTENIATIAYKSNECTVNWSRSIEYKNKLRANTYDADSGTAYLTYSWGARGKWKNTTQGTQPNSINMEWDRDAHWTINGRAKEMDGFTKFARAVTGSSTDSIVPPDLTDNKVPGPDVNLTMDSLDYFLTTNLICPGKHMFKAHAIGQDETKGLAVPHDLIITGDIDSTST